MVDAESVGLRCLRYCVACLTSRNVNVVVEKTDKLYELETTTALDTF